MSEEKKIQGMLTVFATVMSELRDSAIDIMRIHPLNALLMQNFLMNLGYAMFAIPGPEGQYHFKPGIEFEAVGYPNIVVGWRQPSTKGELISQIFRANAIIAGNLLNAKTIAEYSSLININQVARLLGVPTQVVHTKK